MSGTMGAPSMLENGNAVQSRRSTWGFRGASYVLIFVWVILALVPIIFCLLYHQQARGICWAHGYLNGSSTRNEDMSWIWYSDNCKGVVQDEGKYLIIQQTGKYFIYAQLFRKNTTTVPLSLMLFRDSNTTLTNVLGYENGTINFARPFLLNKGDKLHLEQNDNNLKYLLKNQTYWGLFKM